MTKPILAFAHANGIPGGSYKRFLAPFEGQYEVRAIDRMGHDPDYPVDKGWHSLSLELEQFLAPLPKPIVGIGHSLGALLMFVVAQRRPDWFSAVIMLDPPLVSGWPRLLMKFMASIGQIDRVTPAGKSKGRRDRWPDWSSVQRYFASRSLFQRFHPDALAGYLAAGVEPFAEGYRLRFLPAVEVDIFRTTPTDLNRLAPVAVPGAVVTGLESEPLFRAGHRRHIRYHRMTWVDAPGGHLFPLEQPDQAAGIVQALLLQLLPVPLCASQLTVSEND